MPDKKMAYTPTDIPDEAKFLYDLRQRRAKLIADCIEVAVNSLKHAEDYYKVFKDIEDVYCVSEHAYKGDKKKTEEKWKDLLAKVQEVSNKHSDVWNGTMQESVACAEIEKSLRALLQFVLAEIEEAGLFGTSWDDDDGV